MQSKATNGAQTQTGVCPNLNQIQCNRRRAMGVRTEDNTRRNPTRAGAICCILLRLLLPALLFHFHPSYNFCPLRPLKYKVVCTRTQYELGIVQCRTAYSSIARLLGTTLIWGTLALTTYSGRFDQIPTNVNNVALSDNCIFDEDRVTVGATFLVLVTFIWGSQRRFSVGTFSFSWCTVDDPRFYGTTKEALATGHAISVTRQFLPFVAITSNPTLLRWTGRIGPEGEFRKGHVVPLDADGCWLVLVGTLSAFVKTAKMPNCPQ